jgi:hypothetical protein
MMEIIAKARGKKQRKVTLVIKYSNLHRRKENKLPI